MRHYSTLKRIQRSTLAATILLALSPLAHATEAFREDARPNTESESTQQQATPAQPPTEAEPLDADDDTVLV